MLIPSYLFMIYSSNLNHILLSAKYLKAAKEQTTGGEQKQFLKAGIMQYLKA